MLFADVNKERGAKTDSAKAETALKKLKSASAATGWVRRATPDFD